MSEGGAGEVCAGEGCVGVRERLRWAAHAHDGIGTAAEVRVRVRVRLG